MILDDEVYLDKEEARQEYVMSGMGLIWAGTHKNMFTWPWEYSQVCACGHVCGCVCLTVPVCHISLTPSTPLHTHTHCTTV